MSHIYLNWRSTSAFNGESVNQRWWWYVGDFWSGDDGNINYVEFYLDYQTPSSGNDNFVDRTNLGSVSSVTSTGSNVGYTEETGEAAVVPQSPPINSAWWAWTAPDDGLLTVDTIGSGFDTFVTLATGSTVSTLTQEAVDDDSGGSLTSLIADFPVTAGTQYQIAVDGYSSNTGNITLNLSFTPGAAQPNLTPYQPSGWSDKIVVSNQTGTNTDDSPLYTTDTLYVDWAVINNGTAPAPATTWYIDLYVNGSPVVRVGTSTFSWTRTGT